MSTLTLPRREVRVKYNAEQLQKLGEAGEAYRNSDGHYSFPIADADDLQKAVHAVGRSGASHDAIRSFIIKRAKAMGKESMIPDGWQSNAANSQSEWRKARADAMRGAREERQWPVALEVRDQANGTVNLTGYASITEEPYDMGWYSESISRGAFKRTLNDQPDVVLLLNHEGLPLARTKAGTLLLEEDKRGLRVDADLDPQDPDTQTLIRKLRRGDLDGQMSFAFQATDQDWNEEHTERMIKSVSLHRGDVSIVTHGANPATAATVTAREFGNLLMEVRAGKRISGTGESTLKECLSLTSDADDCVDKVQEILSNYLGVPNPDTDEANETADQGPYEAPIVSTSTGGGSEAYEATVPNEVRNAREQLEIARLRGSVRV